MKYLLIAIALLAPSLAAANDSRGAAEVERIISQFDEREDGCTAASALSGIILENRYAGTTLDQAYSAAAKHFDADGRRLVVGMIDIVYDQPLMANQAEDIAATKDMFYMFCMIAG